MNGAPLHIHLKWKLFNQMITLASAELVPWPLAVTAAWAIAGEWGVQR